MDAPSTGVLAGAISAASVAITVAMLRLRRYLSEDSVVRAANGVEVRSIAMLEKLLEGSEQRNAKLIVALDAAHTEIGALRLRVIELSERITSMQRQLTQMTNHTNGDS